MCSRKWLIVALVACGLVSACSDYNTNLSIQTSSSSLTFVAPQTATAGGSGFTITANGIGYVSGAIILWYQNGTTTPLVTTFVSASQLTAPVPAMLLTTAGTVQVSIDIPGSAVSGTTNPNNGNATTTTEISNIVLFTINSSPGPAPTITKLSASTTSQNSTPYCSATGITLTVTGTNFTSDAVVNWNGSARATTFVSTTQLTAAILPTDTAFSIPTTVTVSNSLGTSGSLPFTMVTPAATLAAPSLTGLSQTSTAAGSPALTLNVAGINILPCSVVQWNGVSLATTYVSGAALSAIVPAADFVGTGNAQVTVFTLAPGGGTSAALTFTISPPTITSLSASTTMSSSTPYCSATGLTLTVNGTNFVNTSVVDWNGLPRVTTFVSATQLTAAITTADIALQGTAAVTVSTGSAISTPVNFSVSAPGALPAPIIASLSQVSATAGTGAFSLIVTGSNFLPCTVVQWNGSNRTTAVTSATQVSATITAADIASVGTASVTVSTPATGGTISNAISFSIVAPTITSVLESTMLLPSTPACGLPPGITLIVNGTNFVNGLVVNWNGSPRQTAFVSPTQLTAAIPATDTAFPGSVNITVSSSTTTSLSSPFTTTTPTTPLPAPVIASLLPPNATAGAAAFMLTVDATNTNGGSLVPCSVVNWNGSPRTTTFIGTTGVSAAISATDVMTAGTAEVTVSTLTAGGGGGTSNLLPFTIFATAGGIGSSNARIASFAQAAAVGSGSTVSSAVSSTESGSSLPAPTSTADNRYAVFVLASTDGVTEILGTSENIFVRDTCAGATSGCTPSVTLASIGFNSNPADGDSISPSISADGRYVTFISSATNLVVSDTNGVTDVFVRDTCAGAASGCTPSTQRISVASDGMQFINASTSASISADGRYVTFASVTGNPGVTSTVSASGIFLRDTCGGATGCTPSTQQLQ